MNAQELVDSILYASGNKPGDDFSTKAAGLLKDNDAAKILDAMARTPYDLRIAQMPPGYRGAVQNPEDASGQRNMLISNANENSVNTMLHESIHVIDNHVFKNAAAADATGKPGLKKFQAEYKRVMDEYGGKFSTTQQGSNTNSNDTYRYNPAERLAFGSNSLFASGSLSRGEEQQRKSFDNAAMADVLTLLKLVPDDFKKTTKQLLKQ